MDHFKSNYNNLKMNPKFYWKPMIKPWNLKISLAAEFWSRCNFAICLAGNPYRKLLQ